MMGTRSVNVPTFLYGCMCGDFIDTFRFFLRQDGPFDGLRMPDEGTPVTAIVAFVFEEGGVEEEEAAFTSSVNFFFSVAVLFSSAGIFLSACVNDLESDVASAFDLASPLPPEGIFKENSASVGGRQHYIIHIMKLTAPVMGFEGSMTFIFCSIV